MRLTALALFVCTPLLFAACGDEPDDDASTGVRDPDRRDPRGVPGGRSDQ